VGEGSHFHTLLRMTTELAKCFGRNIGLLPPFLLAGLVGHFQSLLRMTTYTVGQGSSLKECSRTFTTIFSCGSRWLLFQTLLITNDNAVGQVISHGCLTHISTDMVFQLGPESLQFEPTINCNAAMVPITRPKGSKLGGCWDGPTLT
jgi:hypothetical protein